MKPYENIEAISSMIHQPLLIIMNLLTKISYLREISKE